MAAFFYLRSSESNDFEDLFLCPDVKYMIFLFHELLWTCISRIYLITLLSLYRDDS